MLACPLQTWAGASCQMLRILGRQERVLEAHLLPLASSLPTKTGLAPCAGQKNSQIVTVKGVAKRQAPLLPSLREIPHIL